MIGQKITDDTGKPLEQYNKLSPSAYQPAVEVMKLFTQVQQDYQVGWALQHRPLDEFDGYSLLERARKDQQTFAAFVGCEWVPKHKRWRWKGRKNTARNKLINLTARALSGMIFPFVYAKNSNNEEDKMTARVMRILIEDHLRHAKYETKFLYMVLSALVNPAVFVGVEYVEVMQKVKQRLANGTIKIIEAVDELLSGLQLNVYPIDEIIVCDLYSGTGHLQILPVILRIRRIPYDHARAKYAGKFKMKNGSDPFDHVIAGTTRVFLSGQDSQQLFDIKWTEADPNYVQEITAFYRSEDLEVTFCGGVFMGDEENVYNSNPFTHRRMTLINDQWISIPVYPIAMSGFEPIDPAGRFLYYKSGAFKEYWDAIGEDKMHQLAFDATALDTIKPVFISGGAAFDENVMVPGASVGMPQGATFTPYALGPNLAMTLRMMNVQKEGMDDSTQANPAPTTPTPNVPATQTAAAVQQAKMFFSIFSLMIADLINQVGGLSMDCVVQYSTVGELDNTIPGELNMKYKTFLAKGKDKGRNITNKIVFSSNLMGRKFTQEEINKKEWALYNKSGKTPTQRASSDQRSYMINPYQFARTTYTMFVDTDEIKKLSMGTGDSENIVAFNMMTDQRVAPYTDPKAVAEDFVIEKYGGSDPDRYKAKLPQPNMLNSIMLGQGGPEGNNSPGGKVVPPAVIPQLPR